MTHDTAPSKNLRVNIPGDLHQRIRQYQVLTEMTWDEFTRRAYEGYLESRDVDENPSPKAPQKRKGST